MSGSPWWWKLCGVVLFAAAVALVLAPGWIGAAELGPRLIFFAAAILFAGIGLAFFKTKPAPNVLSCPSCGCENRRFRDAWYCRQCGRPLEPEEDDLDPSEINCPHCQEPIRKGLATCPSCSQSLPSFGIDDVKGRPSCRWCHRALLVEGQKFCRYCSAPLAAAAGANVSPGSADRSRGR